MRNVGILTASLLLIYLCTATVAHIHRRNKHSPPFMFGRPPGGFLRSGYTIATGQRYEEIEGPGMKDSYPYLEERWFDQKLDHFDPENTKTWKQRYWYNPHYMRNDSNLAFLFIGGEGPENGVWAANPNVTYIKLAAKYGALVLDLEHRFFGKSRPINDTKTESLLLCTTEQALADLAYFITVMNQQMGPFRWITWGGSYPGSLAAWFREKYPELTIGTVASSAPVNLKLDFWEYALQVEETLRETDPKCADAVDQAFGQIQQLALTVAGRQKLNAYFNLDPPFNENTTKLDITNFQSNLYNSFQGVVQYTYDGQRPMTETNHPYSYTAQHLCQYMTNASVPDVIDRVNIIVQWTEGYYPTSEWGGFNKTNTFANSYWDMIKVYADTTYDDENDDDVASYRGWMWLCCNEIGFLQTLDYGSRNIFHNGVPINFYFDMCVDLFGPTIDTKWVRDKNRAAQEYYGGATKYNTTNSILPNGSLDPWHQLGTYTQIDSQNLLGFVINGTAHCSDMYPVYDGEPPALVAARDTVDQYIQRFINSSVPPLRSLIVHQMTVTLLILVALFSVRGIVEVQQGCSVAGYTASTINGRCYKIVSNSQRYAPAEALCEGDGAYLASVHNSADNSALLAIGEQLSLNIWLGAVCVTSSTCVWADGTPFDYRNFYSSSPDTTLGKCLYMSIGGTAGQWVSIDCSAFEFPAVCLLPLS